MKPGVYDFTVRRGDSEALSVALKSRDVFTLEEGVLDLTGKTVSWAVTNGQTTTVKTSADQGGLEVDVEFAIVTYPLSRAETQALLPSAMHHLYVEDATGHRDSYLVGAVKAEG